MQVSLVLTAIDKASKAILGVSKAGRGANAAVQKDAAKATQAIEKGAKAADKAATAHKKSGKAVEAATAATAKATGKYSGEIEKAKQAFTDLWNAGKRGMGGSKNWTAEQQVQMRKLREEIVKLEKAQERMFKRRERWRKAAESAGNQIGKGIGQPIAGVGQIGRGLMQGGRTAAGIATGAGAYGALSATVSNEIVGPAKEMEQFELRLRNAGKTADQAKASLTWVRDQSLMHSINKATEAFVTLAEAGIKPTEKSFRLLGDAAIAKQQSVAEAAGAVGKALKGETGALSDYGITMDEVWHKGRKYMKFGYEGRDGKKKGVLAAAKNLQHQQAAINKIFEEKYGGSQARFAGTWDGMVQEAQNAFTKMRLKIANAGVFEFLKNKFSEVLETFAELEKSGDLDKWATRISDGLIKGMEIGWEVAKGFGQGIKWVAEQLQWLDQNVISFQNQGKLLLALPFLPALLSIGAGIFNIIGGVANLAIGLTRLAFLIARIVGFSVIAGIFKTVAVAARIAGFAFMFLGRAILATPIGWLIAGITAIAVGAYLIYRNWDKIGPYFQRLWEWVKGIFRAAWEGIKSYIGGVWQGIKDKISEGWNTITGMMAGWKPLEIISAAWDSVIGFFDGWGGKALEAVQKAINKVKDWLGPAADTIGKIFGKIGDGIKAVWDAIWSDGGGDKAGKALADGLTANPAQLASVEAATAGIKANMEAIAAVDTSATLAKVGGLAGDAAKAQEAIGKLTGAARDAVTNVKNYLNSVNLSSYGVAFMATLASGIRGGAGQAVAAVRDATQQMRDHLPHSPAKVGPLSDLHRVKFSETLAGAIKPGPAVAAVRAVAAGMAAAVPTAMSAPMMSAPVMAAPVSSGLPTGQSSGGSANVVINYAPVMNFQGSGPEARESFTAELRKHSDELMRLVDEAIRRRERRQF